MRDPDRTFNDIMRYLEARIKPPESFTSAAELRRWIEDSDEALSSAKGEHAKIRSTPLELITSSNAARNRLSTGKSSIRQQAIKHEMSRPLFSRRVDESRTTKRKVLSLNQKQFNKWKKNPSVYDIKGIDTKTHSLMKADVKNKSRKWKQQGVKIYKNFDTDVFVVRKDATNRPYAMNVVNGKRVPKRIYSKHGTLKQMVKKNK